MTSPDDDDLTTDGLAAPGEAPILILGCGALAHEILAILRANGLDHIELQCLPAIFHNHPEKIEPAVRETVKDARAKGYEQIFLAYADCGTGGQLEKAARELGIEMMQGPHCYAFFEGTDAFLKRTEDDFTSFYLTDFLTRQFDAFVWKPLGLDRHPELLEMYFGHYEKLVYQSQTDDPALLDKARNCAKRLGLAFVHHKTGYGELETEILNLNSVS